MSNLRELAKRLYDQGLAVIPTNSKKAPVDKRWQDLTGDARRDPNGEYDKAAGCGVILGQWHGRGYLHCIDVDCYDKEISKKVCEFIMDQLGESYPYRVGEAPKFAVPVLLPDPLRKMTSKLFDEKSRVEVLGVGQQFVAHGLHPKAKGGKYQWYNGEFSLETTPVMTHQTLGEVMSYFERVCQEAGMEGSGGRVVHHMTEDELDDLDLAIANEPIDMDDQEVDSLLEQYAPDGLDYDSWINVGAALHRQYRGTDDGYDRWMAWSERSDKHNPRGMRKKYDSFGEYQGRSISMATVKHLVKKTPLLPEAPRKGGFLQMTRLNALPGGGHIDWIVENVIERGTIGQVYAPPGVGKSFLVLDMGAHIASGKPWNGHRTVQGPVVYLAGEGAGGLNRRRAAIELEHELDTRDIIVGDMPDFNDPKQLNRLDKELKLVKPSVIYIDTLARAIVGLNENDAGDMGKIVKAMGVLARRHKCAVVIVHHTAKGNTNTSRGSGALGGGMDFEIRLERQTDGSVLVESAKSKDGEGFKPMGFNLVGIELPGNFTDNFGNTISSAVVSWIDANDVAISRPVRLSPGQAAVVGAFEAVWCEESARCSVPAQILLQMGIESPGQGLPVERVREYWRRSRDDVATATQATLRGAWKKALDGCVDKGVIQVFDSVLVKK